MFAELGEVDIFRKVGLTPVFFARTFVGPRMPSLMYMLVHENMAGREKSWDGFRTSPDWKTSPRLRAMPTWRSSRTSQPCSCGRLRIRENLELGGCGLRADAADMTAE